MMFSGAIHSIAALSLLMSTASAAKLVEVTNFGKNPSKAGMHIYVPDKLASKPAVIVAVS